MGYDNRGHTAYDGMPRGNFIDMERQKMGHTAESGYRMGGPADDLTS